MVEKAKAERMRPEDYAPGESPMRRRATYVRKEIVSKGVIHGFFSWLYVIYYALTR